MELWKENKIANKWSLPNKEIATRFLKTNYYRDWIGNFASLAMMLSYFICLKEGFNSTWAKGTKKGEKDFTEICKIIMKSICPECLEILKSKNYIGLKRKTPFHYCENKKCREYDKIIHS